MFTLARLACCDLLDFAYYGVWTWCRISSTILRRNGLQVLQRSPKFEPHLENFLTHLAASHVTTALAGVSEEYHTETGDWP